MVVVHASKDSPEIVVKKALVGESVEKLGFIEVIVKVSPDMVKDLSVSVVVEPSGIVTVHDHSVTVEPSMVVVHAPVVELKDDESDDITSTDPPEVVDVL